MWLTGPKAPTKYVLLYCQCHSCLYHDLSQLQIRLLLCPPKLSLSPLVTSWPVPAPNKCAALFPYVVTVTAGYIMSSYSSKHDCWSVPLSWSLSQLVNHGQTYLKTRLLVCPPKLSLLQLVTSWSVPAPDNTVGRYAKLSLSQLVMSWPVRAQDTTVSLAP